MIIEDKILNSLSDIYKKYDAYLVGGYLRNYFLKTEISNDRDIVVLKNAKEFAKEIAAFFDAAFIELDAENKIYRVVLKDKKNYFDVSEALGNSLEADSKRRDFTINSIFYDLNKKRIYDPYNGISDLKNKIIRTIDIENMKDDFLRILRLYRFVAALNFDVEENLNNFAKENFNLIFNCAYERINQEVINMFSAEYIYEALLKMYNDGVLKKLFPFVGEVEKIPSNSHHHLDLIHHLIETVKNIKTNNPYLKLAAFMHDIAKPVTWTIEPTGRHRFIGHDIKGYELVKKELAKFKFPKKKVEYIAKMVKYHIYPATLAGNNASKKAFARFVKKLGDDTIDVIELSKADRLSALGPAVSKKMVEDALNHLDNLLNYYLEVKSIIDAPKSLLNGNEIMEILNIKPSKKIGIISDMLLEAQMTGEVCTKEDAVEFIKNIK